MSTPQSPAKKAAEGDSVATIDAPKTKKVMKVKVVFLDESSHVFQVQSKALGQSLFEKVCKFIKLLETDYFGLEYEDENHTKYWIDGLKPLCRQVGLTTLTPVLHFYVKFYTPDPAQLEDEYTRYLFSLQLKKDLSCGALQCNDNTAAVMISYIVQADIGDFDLKSYPDHTYLSTYKFVPFQDEELERKIMESHKKHVGQTQAEAESNLLETARRCELYGIKMTAAKDQEGVPLNLSVAHLGVLVFQNYTKINIFSWAKIRKLSFKRKRFLIKLHPEGYGYYKDTVPFYFESRNECKNFWKKCIENHTFFRCSDAKKGMRQKPKIFSRGSSFRYSGRTQVQVSEFVRENYVKRNFQRSTSLNTSGNSPSRSAVGSGSISPQPLLPISTSFSSDSIKNGTKSSPPSKKKFSTSEPTTPHLTEDISCSVAGSGAPSETPKITPVPSNLVVTPDSDYRDFQSPDFLGQDDEDNVSHDSYHVTEKEQGNNNNNDPSDQNKKGTSGQTNGTTPLPRHGSTGDNDDSRSLETSVVIISQNLSSPEYRSNTEDNQISGDSPVMKKSALNGHPLSSPRTNGESRLVEESSNTVSGNDSYISISEPRYVSNKRIPTDKAYHIAKELLMAERTFRRDLEIVNVVFREEFGKQGDMPHEAVDLMLKTIDPLYEVHCSLLRELEQRMASWEGKHIKVEKRSVKGVGDILICYRKLSAIYVAYVSQLMQVLEDLHSALQSNQRFANFYHQFEAHKICYLPVTSLLMKPLFRLSQYSLVLKALMLFYGKAHFDFENCLDANQVFQATFKEFENIIPTVVNYIKLMELERNLVAFPKYVTTGRMFIREGCLQRLAENGNHQCMMFLFSDVLLYTKQIQMGKLLFKVHGCLLLRELNAEETKPQEGVPFGFTVMVNNNKEQQLLFATNSAKERTKWLHDIKKAISSSFSGKSHRSTTDEDATKFSSQISFDDSEDGQDFKFVHEERSVSHVNTSVQVCWCRNLSIGSEDLLISTKTSLSGFLLRRFSNNSGWQKLWVVLSNLCLFFYKTYSDESPLASLPLAGYRVSTPSVEDDITKEFVFKLQYKNHAYFFKAESKYHFDRWMDVLNSSSLAEDEKTHL